MSMGICTDIRNISLKELQDYFKKNSEPAFRAVQVYEWLWKKSVTSFEEMTNLSLSTRKRLETDFFIRPIKIEKSLKSSDGTIKYAFRLCDGEFIEGVLIPSRERVTACISSQVGCALGCKFCATGKMKFKRNLSPGEIYDQVALLQKMCVQEFAVNLTNIVVMGMGEPLLNLNNLLFAIDKITSPEGIGISPRRITVSTSGIVPGIEKLADMEVKFNLAISLHFADSQSRNELVPINKKYDLESLIKAIKYFNQKTGTRITIEYLLLNNINDNISDVKKLALFCKNFPVKINLIEYNKVDNLPFEKTTEEKLSFFATFLESKNLVVNIRRSKGGDINAACGQLANKQYN